MKDNLLKFIETYLKGSAIVGALVLIVVIVGLILYFWNN